MFGFLTQAGFLTRRTALQTVVLHTALHRMPELTTTIKAQDAGRGELKPQSKCPLPWETENCSLSTNSPIHCNDLLMDFFLMIQPDHWQSERCCEGLELAQQQMPLICHWR